MDIHHHGQVVSYVFHSEVACFWISTCSLCPCSPKSLKVISIVVENWEQSYTSVTDISSFKVGAGGSRRNLAWYHQIQDVLQISGWILRGRSSIWEIFLVGFRGYHHPTWCWSHSKNHIAKYLVFWVHKCLWKGCILFCFDGFVFLRTMIFLLQAMCNCK